MTGPLRVLWPLGLSLADILLLMLQCTNSAYQVKDKLIDRQLSCTLCKWSMDGIARKFGNLGLRRPAFAQEENRPVMHHSFLLDIAHRR